MNSYKCFKCLNEWESESLFPRICSSCKSPQWWIELPCKCCCCNKTFSEIHEHHKDGNRKNSSKENRVPICIGCHTIIHLGIGKHNKRVKPYSRINQDTIKNLKELRSYLKKHRQLRKEIIQ